VAVFGDNIGIASIIGLHRVVEVRPVGLCMRAPRLAALVTATSFATIIGLASSSLSFPVRWMRSELGEKLDDLAKLALSANNGVEWMVGFFVGPVVGQQRSNATKPSK